MLDTGFYDTLSRLRLRMSHRSSLNVSGSRKSVRKGNSTEFSDFREYMPGDDLRRLDWNAYARLDKLYIREYMEEKEAAVSVLIDTSASMDYGVKSKADLAVDLTAAVSFLALNNTDRVLLYDMREVDMVSAARKMRCPGAGVTVVISDFLHPDMLEERAENPGYEKLLQYLNYCKQLPVILHTMAAEELHVTLEGALNLIDAETKEKLRLVVDARALDNYERELKRFTERLKKGCACGRGVYVLCDAGKDRRQLVFQDLRVIYDI